MIFHIHIPKLLHPFSSASGATWLTRKGVWQKINDLDSIIGTLVLGCVQLRTVVGECEFSEPQFPLCQTRE